MYVGGYAVGVLLTRTGTRLVERCESADESVTIRGDKGHCLRQSESGIVTCWRDRFRTNALTAGSRSRPRVLRAWGRKDGE